MSQQLKVGDDTNNIEIVIDTSNVVSMETSKNRIISYIEGCIHTKNNFFIICLKERGKEKCTMSTESC